MAYAYSFGKSRGVRRVQSRPIHCSKICSIWRSLQYVTHLKLGPNIGIPTNDDLPVDLLHAGASYLRVHQKGFGAVGVSAKYGKRSFARYPILWGIDKVGSLPNPDPTDTAPWNKEQVKTSDIPVDQELEAAKPDLKRQAQEWAKLKEDPDADLFVFVGRWSQQKGVDLIADVFPSIMENNPKVQLICVGPVIDLYGKFAAMKFARMMEVYPGRVYSKPEFTALPPYIFSGADFALMPSRDEPFGLVAVEFGRKGALCVGARVGGLGQMPGWWFTIESTTTKHVIHQFKIAIQGALSSKPDARAIMRARAAKQRFPVAQWVEDLEKLQTTSIEISQRQVAKAGRQSLFSPSATTTPGHSRRNTPAPSRRATPTHSRNVSRASSPVRDEYVPPLPNGGHSRNVSRASSNVRDEGVPPLPNGGLGSRIGPGYKKKRRSRSHVRAAGSGGSGAMSEAEDTSDEDAATTGTRTPRRRSAFLEPAIPPSPQVKRMSGESIPHPPFSPDFPSSPGLSRPLIPSASGATLSENWFPDSGAANLGSSLYQTNAESLLSLPAVTGGKDDYKLQHVSPFFTDPKKEFTAIFEEKLGKLNGKTSEDQLCIEDYLVKSEKTWFGKMRAAEMGKSTMASPAPSVRRFDPLDSPEGSIFENNHFPMDDGEVMDEFLLGNNYVAPTGLKHILRLRIGEWPLYSILLAFVRVHFPQAD